MHTFLSGLERRLSATDGDDVVMKPSVMIACNMTIAINSVHDRCRFDTFSTRFRHNFGLNVDFRPKNRF